MSEKEKLAERLATARKKAGFKSPREAAQAFDWNENTYKSRENGLRGFSLQEARRYARAFNVSPWWLFTGEGSEQETGRVSVVGEIRANNLVFSGVDEEGSDFAYEIDSLIPVPLRVVGYVVRELSLFPRYDNGDVILCSNDLLDLNNSPEGIEAIVSFRETGFSRLLKRLYPGSGPGKFDLESHNWPTVRDFAVGKAQAIVGVVRAHQQLRYDDREEIRRLHDLIRRQET